MTIPQIRCLVDSLKRKYADELEVYRLQPVAQKFCDDLANAVTGKKRRRPRSTHEWAEIFHRRLQERGLRPPPRSISTAIWSAASTSVSCPRPASYCATCCPAPPAAASSPAPSRNLSPSELPPPRPRI